jgi:hypothetical protein
MLGGSSCSSAAVAMTLLSPASIGLLMLGDAAAGVSHSAGASCMLCEYKQQGDMVGWVVSTGHSNVLWQLFQCSHCYS